MVFPIGSGSDKKVTIRSHNGLFSTKEKVKESETEVIYLPTGGSV